VISFFWNHWELLVPLAAPLLAVGAALAFPVSREIVISQWRLVLMGIIASWALTFIWWVHHLVTEVDRAAERLRDEKRATAQALAKNAELADVIKAQSKAVQAIIDEGQRRSADAARAIAAAKLEAKRQEDRAAALAAIKPTRDACADITRLVNEAWER